MPEAEAKTVIQGNVESLPASQGSSPALSEGRSPLSSLKQLRDVHHPGTPPFAPFLLSLPALSRLKMEVAVGVGVTPELLGALRRQSPS